MKKIFITICFYLFFCQAISAQTLVQPPQTDRLESERLFSYAYDAFLNRRYWDGEELVGMSLNADPYNIDGYLLRALINHGKGHFAKAITDLRSYLEVRPRDHTARKILSGIEKVHSVSFFSPAEYAGYKQSLNVFFDLMPGSFTGTLGIKHGGGFGEKIALADSFAGKVQILDPKRKREIPFDSPSDVTFLSYKRFVVIGEKGDFVEYEDQGDFFHQLRSGDIGPGADSIAFLSSSLFAVSFPLERAVKFFTYPGLDVLDQWNPGEKSSFEPRGIASRGDTLAVPDRRNGKVYLFSWEKEEPFVSLDVSAPRSVVWGPTGDLLVLSDNGFLSVFSRDGGLKWLEVDRVPASEAICLLRSEDRVFMISSTGRAITALDVFPGRKEGLVLSSNLFKPRTESINEDTGQAVEVSLNLSSPFFRYIYSQRGVLSSVWQDTMRGGRISEAEGWDFAGVILSPGNRYRFNGDSWVDVSSEKSLEDSVKKMWKEMPFLSQIVLDSGINLELSDAEWLLNFCMVNGVYLSIWATKTPSDFIISMVENTGGNVYYSDSLSEGDLKGLKTKSFTIKIFYPDTVYSSGYPSKNMLSIIADFGMISYRGWLPIWPDMLRQ